MTEQENYMAQALALAREAAAAGEVPVGCVIVRGGEIVGRGRNRREEKQSTASHAEMEAIAMANETVGSWRLDDCTLYVTVEPCVMCAGACFWSQLGAVVYGASDPKRGAGRLSPSPFHPKTVVRGGVLQDECEELMTRFFARLRT